jgi:hypothetical protein
MTNKYTTYFLPLSIVLLVFLLVFGRGDTSVAFTQRNKSKEAPVVDYQTEIAGSVSKARSEKSICFRGLSNPDKRKPIGELPFAVEPLPINSHWWIGLTALPVQQSDIVILGNIIAKEAHLSDDRTGIYSEFTVQITEVLADATKKLIVGASLTVNRPGGKVRFASGRIQSYEISGQGMPGIAQYALFLRKTDDGDFLIVTGYELSGEKVIPLDGEDISDPRSNLPFAKYRNADQVTFLKELHEEAGKSPGGGAK